MSKDPAFLFYPGDWLGGTMHMQRISRACYFDLLILQFNRGPFSMQDIKSCLGVDIPQWDNIKDKFEQEKSMYYNERLRKEINKRKAFTESRKAGAYAMHKHMLMENENEDKNKDVIKDKNIIPIHLKDAISAFVEHRKKLKKPMTEKAIDLTIKKAQRLYPTSQAKQVECINQAIERGWQGIFEIKEENKQQPQKPRLVL